MKKCWFVLLTLLLSSPLAAGVVYEIEVKDHEASPPRTEDMQVMVEGENLKMSIPPGQQGSNDGSMIFRGDRKEMVIVDDENKAYTVIDEAAIAEIGGHLSQAMKQMEEALKNVPEDQREMVEKMMKERMPQEAAEAPKTTLRKTGDRAEKNGYPAVRYEAIRDGRKVRELWVTDWKNVEGGSEAAGAFEAMSEFFSEMMDAMRGAVGAAGGGPFGQIDDSMMEQLKELGGFPVEVRELDEDGELESESSLRSAKRRTLDPSEFEPPAGYKRRSMMGG